MRSARQGLNACLASFVGLVLLGLLSAGIADAKKQPPARPVDLNEATLEQLKQLPGIGPGTARAIVQFRRKSGPFRRVEDLLAIPGISKARLEKIRPYIVVHPPAAKSPSPQ